MPCPNCNNELVKLEKTAISVEKLWLLDWEDKRGCKPLIKFCPYCGFSLSDEKEDPVKFDQSEINKLDELANELRQRSGSRDFVTGQPEEPKVKILGQVYTIVKKDRQDVYLEHGDLKGKVIYDDGKIYVADGLNPGDLRGTLIHEVVHIIDRDFDLALSEANIKRLAVCLAAVMADNEKAILKLFYGIPKALGMQSMINRELYGPGDVIPVTGDKVLK